LGGGKEGEKFQPFSEEGGVVVTNLSGKRAKILGKGKDCY